MATATAHSLSIEARTLNPFVTYDPAIMQKSNTRWKAVCLVAAPVTAVAFTALATTAIIYTTIHFPIHLPTVSILVFAAGMPTSFRAFKYLWDKKDHYAQESSIDAQLIQHMKANTQGDPKLKSVQARYDYYQSEKSRFEKLAKQQGAAKICEHKATLCHLKSAYFLHLMDNSYENRPMSNFFQFAPFDPYTRYLAMEHGDKTVDILLKTPSRNYTQADLLRKSPEQLKREVFEGKRSFFG